MAIEDKRDPGGFPIMLEAVRGFSGVVFFSGASEEDIAQFEDAHGIQLPVSFRTFLRTTNGAVLTQSEIIYGIKLFYSDDDALRIGIDQALEMNVDSAPPGLVPFTDTSLYFDTHSKDESGEHLVVLWNGKKAIPIANSFRKWFEKFVLES